MGELLDSISSEELTEWMAFYRLEPFGPDAQNWQAGNIAATIANYTPLKVTNRGRKPSDFMLKFPKEQTPEEMMEMIGAFLGGANG